MPLFSNPVTLNNGADHIFLFRNQLFDSTAKKSIVGVWVEPAAPLADESTITVKHDSSSPTVRRRLVQRKVNRATVTRGNRPITINVTIAYDTEHTDAYVEAELALVKDMFAEATFAANLLDGLI
jgi:hypothetical protein